MKKQLGLSPALTALKWFRRNPYAWPGGYQIIGLMQDSEPICYACLVKNYELIFKSTLYNGVNPYSSWDFEAYFAHWEGLPLVCCNCNKELQSEYGDSNESIAALFPDTTKAK